jgi:hypothetical protein
VGIDNREVSGATGLKYPGNGSADGLLEGGDHFEDTGAAAGAEIENVDPGIPGKEVDGGDMAGGEVADVDEVADAGAVGGGIVVAEDVQAGEAAHGDLRHIGNEVVRNPLGIFADQA